MHQTIIHCTQFKCCTIARSNISAQTIIRSVAEVPSFEAHTFEVFHAFEAVKALTESCTRGNTLADLHTA